MGAIDEVISDMETRQRTPREYTQMARAELAALRSRVAELEADNEKFNFLLVANNAASVSDLGGMIDALVRQNTQQAAQLEQARNTLEFYAAPENYKGITPNLDTTEIDLDSGEKARDWLAANAPAQDGTNGKA